MGTSLWYVRTGGKVFGPFPSAKLANFARAGKITPSTEVGTDQNGPWRRANTVTGLTFGDAQETLTPPPLPEVPTADLRTNQKQLTAPPAAAPPQAQPESPLPTGTKANWWSRYWQKHGFELIGTSCAVLICLGVALVFNRPWVSEETKVRAHVEMKIFEKYGQAATILSITPKGGGNYSGAARVGASEIHFEAAALRKGGRKLNALLNLGAYDISCQLTVASGNPTPTLPNGVRRPGRSGTSPRIVLAGTNVSFIPPPGLAPLPLDVMRKKWPSEQRPQFAIGNTSGGTTVAFDIKPNDISRQSLDSVRAGFVQLFNRMVPGIVWHQSIVLTINGREWVLLEMSSSAVDTDIHNILLVSAYGRQMILFNFNSTREEIQLYRDAFKASIESIRDGK